MKLHLGCGHNYLEGWVNVDGPKEDLCYDDLKADIHARIEDLEYSENSIDEILMEAVFEHFPRHVAIMQLRKFYNWLKPNGGMTILVPDFWGIVKMLKKSKSPQERQFWYRTLFGPQDTLKFGVHYDAFDIDKLKWMFSVAGFSKYNYEFINYWPSIKFTGIKCANIKSDKQAEHDIIKYMAYCEAKDEKGLAFGSWMKAMGLNAQKPETPIFYTQELSKRPNHSILELLKEKIRGIL